ncbi:hypothetical protein HBN50_13585 [Halobacteriovorax sp. GB3]|uniref:hypothetical protein n=1 Tax=Halobacteriovorax sp. GB3 TaxID=2719615 RepID=UPI00235FFA19|nr:hypothetical protein [Halobacteriovorax sp. GB3]MDD0854139.1 hypothetical protein [Halobacteriovorax sp. GB3]
MKFEDIKVYRGQRFSIEKEIETQKLYITFPVFNGRVEYTEFYEISELELEKFLLDEDHLFIFVQECRNKLHDDRLLLEPGSSRGTP